MSAMNDLMVKLLGVNWRTSMTAWATAISGLAAVIALALNSPKSAIVCGALSAIAKIMNGIVAADAANTGLSTANPVPPVPPSTSATPPEVQP